MEDLSDLFTLDRDEGYTLRLEIWPNDEKTLSWTDQFMIQPGDFDKENSAKTMKRMKRFLNQYKKGPSIGRIEKRERRPQNELNEIKDRKARLAKAINDCQ